MSANINIKIDENLKERAETLFEELGLNMTTAINVFLRQTVYENKIPNAETVAAIKAADDESQLSPRYSNMKDLIEELHT